MSSDSASRPESSAIRSYDADKSDGTSVPIATVHSRTKRLAAAVGLGPSVDKVMIESLRQQLTEGVLPCSDFAYLLLYRTLLCHCLRLAANAETQRARDEAKQTVDSCNARIEELLRQQALEIRGRQLQVWGVRRCFTPLSFHFLFSYHRHLFKFSLQA